MALRRLNLRASNAAPWSRQRVVLDGVEVVVDLDWNGREGRWYATLSTPDGRLLAGGRKLVAGGDLARAAEGDPFGPGGRLRTIDTSGSGADPGIDDLGSRVFVVYLDEADRRALFGPFPPAAPAPTEAE